jgi:hypothetical protein
MKKIINVAFFTLLVLNLSFANPKLIAISSNYDEIQKTNCKGNKRIADRCYWVKGTLAIGNGNPATRLRASNFNRVLGIKDDENPILPENVLSKLTTDNEIFGNYYFCPFSKYKRGRMQVGCIQTAKNIQVK